MTSVHPSSGPLSGGSVITIHGVGLGNGTDVVHVMVAGFSVGSVVWQSFEQCVVVTGAAASAQTGVVEVHSLTYGNATGGAFTYNPGNDENDCGLTVSSRECKQH